MDERAPSAELCWNRLDWKLVALLLLLAAGLRVWQLTHTEVAARDSIGFIRHAWHFRQAPVSDWPEVLAHSEQHPLYPLAILAVSRALEPCLDSPTELMQWSAQLASALAAVLMVLPVYLLGRALFDRRVGFCSALLLQCLPVSGYLFADGMSESLFLLWSASALYFGTIALRQGGRLLLFALSGLCGGLAYLTRPEGAFLVAAAGLVLLAGQFVQAWRRSWRGLVTRGGALAVGSLLCAIPFIACTGKLTVKPTGNAILDHGLTDARPAAGPLFAAWDLQENRPDVRSAWGAKALVSELVKGSFYLGWLAALVGFWLHLERFRSEPGLWMMALVCLATGYVLWRVAAVAGYLSERHTLLILLCVACWAAAGLVELGERLRRRWPRLSAAPVLLPLCFALAGLPRTLEPLHGNRAGFRAAGLWLAEHTHPLDQIEDPLCWAHYYAGRVFLEHTFHTAPPGWQPRRFIVIENAGNAHPRVPAFQQARDKTANREPVYTWNGKRGNREAAVHIYAVPIEQ